MECEQFLVAVEPEHTVVGFADKVAAAVDLSAAVVLLTDLAESYAVAEMLGTFAVVLVDRLMDGQQQSGIAFVVEGVDARMEKAVVLAGLEDTVAVGLDRSDAYHQDRSVGRNAADFVEFVLAVAGTVVIAAQTENTELLLEQPEALKGLEEVLKLALLAVQKDQAEENWVLVLLVVLQVPEEARKIDRPVLLEPLNCKQIMKKQSNDCSTFLITALFLTA